MHTWQEVVADHIVSNLSEVQKTTDPLHTIFGIDYFTYHRIDRDGRYMVLLDRPDWAEHYVSEKLYLQDPYLQHVDAYTSGLCMVDMNGSETYKQLVMEAGSKFDMDLGVCLLQKQDDVVEFFGFSASKTRSTLNQLYLSQPNLLVAFAEHFKRQHAKTILKLKANAPFLTELKGQKLSSRPLNLQLDHDKHLSFLNALGMQSYVKQFNLLSLREKECFTWLLRGKSAKETALQMSISPRTVESYFENVKVKLDCWGKNEVFEIARTLNYLGLLP